MKVRTALALTTGLAVVAAGVWLVRRAVHPPRPDPVTLVERVKEVARLQTLEVRLSKTVTHAPDPAPSHSLPGEVLSWVVHSVRPKEGRANVGGVARLGLDLARLEADDLRVDGDVVTLVLPPVVTTVELDLERTEVVRSNLDSTETAELFEKGRRAMAAEIQWNPGLEARARVSAETALRSLLTGLGFREVVFVETLPATRAGA